jgi:O-antigen/teichoic acid export membrane protein
VVIATGLVVVGLTITLGETLLVLIGGSDVARGGAILLPLAVGAAFELASVSYEPVLHATGHPSYPLIARMLAAVAVTGAIIAFVGFGPVGIGWAVALGMAVSYLAMSFAVVIALPRERPA